jgi:hypothetical protein
MPGSHPKIACLGWGSLIWDPRSLPIRRPWFTDGPLLPIEFARESKDKRITLVIVPNNLAEVACVRALWALMVATDLGVARAELAKREGTDVKNISCWPDEVLPKEVGEVVEAWAKEKALDGVVWTALSPKFNNEDCRMPGVDEVLKHLGKLSHSDYAAWNCAQEYVRKAPRQIDTEWRRRMECEFGWTPISEV